MSYAVIASEEGRHGQTLVGPFPSQEDAEGWRDARHLRGAVRALLAGQEAGTVGLVVREGENGTVVAGPFVTTGEADSWLAENGREGFTIPAASPDAWQSNEGGNDDEDQ